MSLVCVSGPNTRSEKSFRVWRLIPNTQSQIPKSLTSVNVQLTPKTTDPWSSELRRQTPEDLWESGVRGQTLDPQGLCRSSSTTSIFNPSEIEQTLLVSTNLIVFSQHFFNSSGFHLTPVDFIFFCDFLVLKFCLGLRRIGLGGFNKCTFRINVDVEWSTFLTSWLQWSRIFSYFLPWNLFFLLGFCG